MYNNVCVVLLHIHVYNVCVPTQSVLRSDRPQFSMQPFATYIGQEFTVFVQYTCTCSRTTHTLLLSMDTVSISNSYVHK